MHLQYYMSQCPGPCLAAYLPLEGCAPSGCGVSGYPDEPHGCCGCSCTGLATIFTETVRHLTSSGRRRSHCECLKPPGHAVIQALFTRVPEGYWIYTPLSKYKKSIVENIVFMGIISKVLRSTFRNILNFASMMSVFRTNFRRLRKNMSKSLNCRFRPFLSLSGATSIVKQKLNSFSMCSARHFSWYP